MKTVALDVHADVSQLALVTKDGEVLLEMQVPTRPEELRRFVAGIPGPKRVVFEEVPMSGLIHDALKDVADEVTSVDPTRNALISRAEDASDEKDAVRLAMLANNRSTRAVYVPEEPHRTLRSLTRYDHTLADAITTVKNAMKALCRRWAIPCKGTRIYGKKTRDEFCSQLPSSMLRWQFQSLARRLDSMDLERTRAKRTVAKLARKLPVIEMLKAIPGIKSVGAPTLVAWIAAQRPAFGWTPGDSRVEALEHPTPGSGSARGLQTGNRRGARGRRNARRSGPSAERAVRVATGNSNASSSSPPRPRSKGTTASRVVTRRVSRRAGNVARLFATWRARYCSLRARS